MTSGRVASCSGLQVPLGEKMGEEVIAGIALTELLTIDCLSNLKCRSNPWLNAGCPDPARGEMHAAHAPGAPASAMANFPQLPVWIVSCPQGTVKHLCVPFPVVHKLYQNLGTEFVPCSAVPSRKGMWHPTITHSFKNRLMKPVRRSWIGTWPKRSQILPTYISKDIWSVERRWQAAILCSHGPSPGLATPYPVAPSQGQNRSVFPFSLR